MSTLRGRAPLGAFVPGAGAAWILSQLAAVDVEKHTAGFRRIGRPDVASGIEQGLAQLREAARQWQERTPSDGGSAEVPPGETVRGSASAMVDTATAAASLGVGQRRVRQLLTAEVLAGRRVAGRWVVDSGDLARMVAERRLTA